MMMMIEKYYTKEDADVNKASNNKLRSLLLINLFNTKCNSINLNTICSGTPLLNICLMI